MREQVPPTGLQVQVAVRLASALTLALLSSSAGFPAEGGWQRDPTPLLTNFDNMYQPCVVEV
ncbi:MAG: hypothetical protein GW880_01155, partial [Armatimonadetes bacterium]|nr:hypothetical protein [Armatimonadota bacterium]